MDDSEHKSCSAPIPSDISDKHILFDFSCHDDNCNNVTSDISRSLDQNEFVCDFTDKRWNTSYGD